MTPLRAQTRTIVLLLGMPAGLLAAASCASAPPRVEVALDVEIPERWTAAGDGDAQPPLDEGLVEDDWWRSFERHELDLLVTEALEASPSFAAAVARVEAARSLVTIAGADALPRLSAGAAVERQQNQFFAPGSGARTNRFTAHSLSLSSSWEIDLWGRIRSAEAAALADLQANEAALAGVRLSLVGQVVRGYFRLVDAGEQVAVAVADRDSVRALSDRIRLRFQQGLRSALDLRLALTDLANSEAELATRRNELDTAARRLEVLLGRYPRGTLAPASSLPAAPPAVPAGLPARLLERRPDLVSAERRLAAQLARVDQARAARLPRLTLTAGAGTISEQLADVIDKDLGVWNLAAGLAAPLFEGGRLRADVERNRSEAEAAARDFVNTALRAFAEVEIALRTGQTLQARETALAEALAEAEASLRLSEERYLGGVLDVLDVLTARRLYFNARRALLVARRTTLENRVDLCIALGGGFQAYAPPPPKDPR